VTVLFHIKTCIKTCLQLIDFTKEAHEKAKVHYLFCHAGLILQKKLTKKPKYTIYFAMQVEQTSLKWAVEAKKMVAIYIFQVVEHQDGVQLVASMGGTLVDVAWQTYCWQALREEKMNTLMVNIETMLN